MQVHAQDGASCFERPRRIRRDIEDLVESYLEVLGSELSETGSQPIYHSQETSQWEWFFKYEDGDVEFLKYTDSRGDETWVLSKYGGPRSEVFLKVIREFPQFAAVSTAEVFTSETFDDDAKTAFEAVAPTDESILDKLSSKLGVSLDRGGQSELLSLVDRLEESLETVREIATLDDAVEALQKHDSDAAKTILGVDDEAVEAIDKMLTYWKADSRGGKKRPHDTELDIPYKDDVLMLVRAERYYSKNDEFYPVGYVVGHDDTDDPFFVHRINYTKKLDDPEYDWTLDDVRSCMGFDVDLDHEESDGLEMGKRYRVQGDLTLTRQDYDSEYDMSRRRRVNRSRREYDREFADTYVENHAPDLSSIEGVRQSTSRYGSPYTVTVTKSFSTDELKDMQESLGIEESAVRSIQEEHDDWVQLTSQRRAKAIEIVLQRRFQQWANGRIPIDDIESEVDEEMREEFEESRQVNLVIGNHLCIFDDALVHPSSSPRSVPVKVLVPEETNLYVIHDEHDQKQLTLPKGAYMFEFLTRHQNN